jgi:hypothetical protein
MSFQAMAWAVAKPCDNAGEKLVLIMLANHTNGHTGQCNPSHKLLADECSMGVSTLKRHLQGLADKGYISVVAASQDNVSLPNQYLLKLEGVGPNRAGGQSNLDGGVGPNRATKQELKPVIEPFIEANASLSGSSFPPCPHQEILKLYAKHLPHCAQPRIWDGARAAYLKARWVQASKPSSYSPGGYSSHVEGLEWWDSFFEYVAGTKLSKGFESHGRIWKPDITWMIKAENFAKIIEQRYE